MCEETVGPLTRVSSFFSRNKRSSHIVQLWEIISESLKHDGQPPRYHSSVGKKPTPSLGRSLFHGYYAISDRHSNARGLVKIGQLNRHTRARTGPAARARRARARAHLPGPHWATGTARGRYPDRRGDSPAAATVNCFGFRSRMKNHAPTEKDRAYRYSTGARAHCTPKHAYSVPFRNDSSLVMSPVSHETNLLLRSAKTSAMAASV